jgi:mannose-6-phosphate isomerase-like protein (cupin superfamily)
MNILSKSLIPKDWSNVKMVFTKVLPEGEFSDHIDNYHHVLLFLEGSGIVKVNDKEYDIKPNLVVKVPAGTRHSYKNKGKDELHLITVNIPINE